MGAGCLLGRLAGGGAGPRWLRALGPPMDKSSDIREYCTVLWECMCHITLCRSVHFDVSTDACKAYAKKKKTKLTHTGQFLSLLGHNPNNVNVGTSCI